MEAFVDIHCHLLPEVDDGAADRSTALAMARMAVEDGIHTIVCTPHQLGNYRQNRAADIRARCAQLQQWLDEQQIELRVLPGADVRIEEGLIELLRADEVLTLADGHRHVLLELPHDVYFPLDGLLRDLESEGLTGILSHPERNLELLRRRDVVETLVDAGCLMQITAGSLAGTFGPQSLRYSEWMLRRGLVHFVATDAHGQRARRPLLRRAYDRAAALVGSALARELCCQNPARVVQREPVTPGRRRAARRLAGFLGWRLAG